VEPYRATPKFPPRAMPNRAGPNHANGGKRPCTALGESLAQLREAQAIQAAAIQRTIAANTIRSFWKRYRSKTTARFLDKLLSVNMTSEYVKSIRWIHLYVIECIAMY